MNIATNIKRMRKNAGLTQAELAEKIGVTRATVTQWETGWSQPRIGMVEKLALVFSVPVSQIVSSVNANTSPFVDIPLYGSIAAGTPIEMMDINDTHPIPSIVNEKYPNAFLLKVEGESMNRRLPNGCYALVDPERKEPVLDNRAYAVCVNGYDATIKRIRKLNNGFELVPDSTDPTYKPVIYDYGVEGTETITIIGEVVWYTIPFDFVI